METKLLKITEGAHVRNSKRKECTPQIKLSGFWLNKLGLFVGDFVQATITDNYIMMVKASEPEAKKGGPK